MAMHLTVPDINNCKVNKKLMWRTHVVDGIVAVHSILPCHRYMANQTLETRGVNY
jgi:hypothetical protein